MRSFSFYFDVCQLINYTFFIQTLLFVKNLRKKSVWLNREFKFGFKIAAQNSAATNGPLPARGLHRFHRQLQFQHRHKNQWFLMKNHCSLIFHRRIPLGLVLSECFKHHQRQRLKPVIIWTTEIHLILTRNTSKTTTAIVLIIFGINRRIMFKIFDGKNS